MLNEKNTDKQTTASDKKKLKLRKNTVSKETEQAKDF